MTTNAIQQLQNAIERAEGSLVYYLNCIEGLQNALKEDIEKIETL